MATETNPTTAAMTDAEAATEARRIIADFAAAYQPTAVRVDDPTIPSWKDGPRIGDTPPVAQEGRPPMSQKATDASTMMLSGGAASLMVGGAVSLVLWSSGHADPNVVFYMCAAPPAAFLSLKALVKGFKRAAVPDVHQHTYTGPVTQHQRTDNSRSVWHKTINQK